VPVPNSSSSSSSPYLQPNLQQGKPFIPSSLPQDDAMPLPWDILQGLVQGESVIDQSVIHIRSRQEAHRLALAYGFDLTSTEDSSYLNHLLAEALHFIADRLLEPGHGEDQFASLQLSLPEHLYERDIVSLCMMASDKSLGLDSQWACAILKVLHTLIHIDYTPRLQWLEQAQEQFVQGYSNVLRYCEDANGVVLSSGDKQLLLYGVELKEHKTRDSLLMKLLSRKNNVVELIDDLMGIRLITHSIPDVLIALDILMDAQLLIFSNIKAERSRNTLIDMDEFQHLWKYSHAALKPHGETTKPAWEDLLSTLRQLEASLPAHNTFSTHNPHSDVNYRALHITTRQFVKVPSLITGKPQRVFFPYEIQCIDKAHYISNQEGDIAHSRYKHRQLQRSRRRVLGDLLPLAQRELQAPLKDEPRLKQAFTARDSMGKRNLPFDHNPPL
jgi:uncharacterized protein (TIGR04562 family)